ncbi:MAG: zinc-binding dehydrogenase [Anaerolineae bacterium]|nr:zinc-binding dehydrogenase [Anaerolineae bacterium]NIN97633.1 zinc-binding dehydrogenase [Anaerolineae bacterium]NIQ80577.1 zinc-binding dehydrogenase [Anaerolineae bacterium]
MYKAAVMVAPEEPLEMREFPEPETEPGAILLRTIYGEVCGTDVHLHHGRLAGVPYPIIPGHVSVGHIVRISGEVTDVEGEVLHEGDVVTFLDVHETCGRCWFCLVAKATTRCPSRRVYGITYSAEEGLLGGWSEAIYLKPGVKVIKLPQGVTPERYIAAGCGLPTAIHSLERAEVRLGDTVAIQGCGPVGLNTAILAQLSGATQVIVLGAPQGRLDLARAVGADHTIDIDEQGPEERIARVQELTGGRGVDVTIEATGNPAAIPEGMRMTRDNGRYVVVGQYTDAGTVEINPHWDINRKHLEIRGCWGSDFSHFYRGIKVLAKHGDKFPYEGFITRVYRLEDMNDALSDVEGLQVVKAVVQP